MRKLMDDPCVRVALFTLTCFLLASTGWIMWLYHLASLQPAIPVDVLTLVVGYLMQALGIGSFALLERKQQDARLRKNVIFSLVSYVICLGLAVLMPNLATTLAFGYLSNLLCGYMQAYYLLCLATHVDARHRGIVFGGAYAASTLLGWLIALPADGILTRGLAGWLTCCVLAVPAIFLAYLPLPALPPEDEPAESPPAESPAAGYGSLIPIACVVVVLMSTTKSAGFSFPASDLAQGVSLEFTRLLYGVGLLAAGFASDRDRRYGTVCCAMSLAMPFVMVLLSSTSATATLLWALG